MADQLPATKYYRNLGGVNLKASLYEMSPFQFLNIRNMDFDVPGALQQRPGSTFGATNTLSGPVIALAEFEKLNGSSWVIAHDSTALWFRNANTGFTPLATSGWSLSQPADMQVFNNKLFAMNGNTAISWDGSTVYPLGLPCPKGGVTYLGPQPAAAGVTVWTLWGDITLAPYAAAFTTFPGILSSEVFLAYSYIRGDGYYGPCDFSVFGTDIVGQSLAYGLSNGNNVGGLVVSGFTAPGGLGVTAIAVWLGVFPYTSGSWDALGITTSRVAAQQLGTPFKLSNPNLSQFYLYTLLATSTQTMTIDFGGKSYSGANFHNQPQFSGMPFCWFNTNTPKYMEIGQARQAVFSGFSNAPSRVWITDTDNPEIIASPEDNFDVLTDNGDVIRGIKQFNNQTILLKERSFHALIGNSFDNFQVVPISTEYGCLSNKSIVEYKQYLLWLDRQGVIEFNGTSFDIISTAVEPIFRRMNVSAARDKACAVHYKSRNQIWFGIPIDGSSVNNITVVFDYFIKAWTFFDGFGQASLAQLKGQLDNETAWRGDYSGHVHYYGPSFYTDSGTQFTCLALTRFEALNENQTNLWRRFFLDVSPVSGLTGNIGVKCFSNYDTSTVQFTASIVQNVYQSRAEMGVEAKSIAVEFAARSASMPLLVNGYAFAARGLRNV